MTLSKEQLEWIVQEVVRRLTEQTQSVDNENLTIAHSNRELVLEEKLITTHTLVNQLEGITHVRFPERAVITPAAKDYLRDLRITFN